MRNTGDEAGLGGEMSSVRGHSKLALGIQVSILSELLVIASTGEVKAGNLNLRFSMMWLILKAMQLGEIIQGASLDGEGRDWRPES